jgi:hypothetical protein
MREEISRKKEKVERNERKWMRKFHFIIEQQRQRLRHVLFQQMAI